MDLTQWARLQGIHPQTGYRRFRQGTLPVPAVRVNSRPVLVAPDAVIAPAEGGTGLHARVSSHYQGVGLDRQVARLTARAAQSCRAAVQELKAAGCARRDIGPQAVVSAGRQDAGRE